MPLISRELIDKAKRVAQYAKAEDAFEILESQFGTEADEIEVVQDIVADLIQDGTGITWTYDDANDTLTANVSLGAFNIDDLADVSVTSVADNELLAYDTATGEWINQTPDEADVIDKTTAQTLTNKTITNPVFDDYIDLNETSEPSDPGAGVARLFNLDEGGFSTIHWKNGSGTDHEISRDTIHVVRNVSGGVLSKGEVVYITGSNGAFPTVDKARANSNSTMPAFGIVINDISNNAFGQIQQGGDIGNLDTSAYTEGQQLYVSAATAGALTATAPTGTDIPQTVAIVTKANAGSGILSMIIGPQIDPGLTATLTNKTIDSASNTLTLDLSEGTLTGTKAEFDTACSEGDFAYQQDAAEFTTLDVTGQAVFGDASPQSVFGGTTPSFQQLGTDANTAGFLLGRWSNNAGVGQFAALKSRATTIGNHAIVNNGDNVMLLRGYADDGVDYESELARIAFTVDGTPGAGDMPGRIGLFTTADGAGVPTENVRVQQNGDVNVINNLKIGGVVGDPPTDELEVDGTTKTKFLNFGSVASQTISGGAITVNQSYTRINSEGGAASDDLDTINGTSQGDFIFIRPASNTETIVVKDNADNLRTAGDFAMDSVQDFMLLFNIDGTNLVEMSRSNNQ